MKDGVSLLFLDLDNYHRGDENVELADMLLDNKKKEKLRRRLAKKKSW